ncbi:hypothetical protein KSZ_09120 [Dictyobacter formicarum]|uniref:Uncharacterized protein n=1 Tax=Dictyobacter formicarum TaxID=2778368 RepID=A0ABQ3VCI3_9CHLR|nr:hypothetical protein KSZ_09120 [Dictyobacter formicarum]
MFQAFLTGGCHGNREKQRIFGAEQKVVGKPLDKAQWICDTTAHETSERKKNKRLSDDETLVSSIVYLDN